MGFLKKNYKIIVGIVVIYLIATIGMMLGGEEKESDSQDNNQTVGEVDDNKAPIYDLTALTTYEDVKGAYEENIDKITNDEKLQELDMKEVTLDYILDKATDAKNIASNLENSSDKIDTIEKLVTLDDLSNNTSQVVMEDTIKHIIEQYEQDVFKDNMEVSLYLTRYLDKRLDNHPNMKVIDDMIFDMYVLIKDSIRSTVENEDAININKEQIDEVIDQVKSMLSE